MRAIFLLLFFAAIPPTRANAAIPVDLRAYTPASGIRVTQTADTLTATWPTDANATTDAALTLDLRPSHPLIARIVTSPAHSAPTAPVVTNLDPTLLLTIGSRDLTKPEGWTIFFDKTYEREHHTYPATLDKKTVRVTSDHQRCTLRIGDLTAGPFHGALEITVYANCPLIRFDSVLRTGENGKAILYDAGLTTTTPDWRTMQWHDASDTPRSEPVDPTTPATPLEVASRTLVAQSDGGSLALFPAPHQFFPPLDFVTNMGFVWRGANYRGLVPGYGFGIRQPLKGDERWVPWFNAPPDVDHHLTFYCLVSPSKTDGALAEVRRFTHGDRFKPLPGYKTYTSHYHIEHTLGFVRHQREQKTTGIPKGEEIPGFVTAFKQKGVDIVHLAEFHAGDTPHMTDAQRLPLLKTLFDECARLSDNSLLILPGEEPNVWLGGHWLALFPKPVYWVLNRSAQTPFVENIDGYGTVYHVGNPDDILHLVQTENGLMWTAHARIKASRGFPDNYWTTDFFRSDRFLGAAWKAMPADLSMPKLGTRVLDLMDDMANAGLHKTVIGEVDAFDVKPDYELYGPMNVNYLRMDTVPKFADGWQPILDTLRAGKLFVTTGEVLLPTFTVGNAFSGDTLTPPDPAHVTLEAHLDATFPLAYAEIISGDGTQIYRQRIDLADTPAFAQRTLHLSLDLRNRKWVRLEVWDTATDGAFTEPVWLK